MLPKSKRELRQSTWRACKVQCRGWRLRSRPKCSPLRAIPGTIRQYEVVKKETLGLTNAYPKLQLVKIIPMVTLMFAEPNMCPTTVGIMETIPPTVNPDTRTKRINTPNVLANGQTTNIQVPRSPKDAQRTFKEPNLSLMKPQLMRPRAEDALKPATSPAPVALDRPIDSAKVGMQ